MPSLVAADCPSLLAAEHSDKAVVEAALEEARARSWLLADGFTDEDLATPVVDYLSPPVWDLGHMANFEERWLVQELRDCHEMWAGFNDTYNAFEHPRHERPTLKLLDRPRLQAYMADVRQRALAGLAQVDPECGEPLLRELFVYWMLVLHEHQHQETLLQTIQMRGASQPQAPAEPSRLDARRRAREPGGADQYRLPDVRRLPRPPADVEPGWVDVPGGSFEMGAAHAAGNYDNEALAHEVDVPAFQMARFPVSNGEYLKFLEAGGYDDRSLWSERGRQWLAETEHHAPLHWRHEGGAWRRVGFGCQIPIAEYPDEILSHVTHFEAEAYAAWAGARLPMEVEWEKAARWDPGTGDNVGRNPWGDSPATTEIANVDQLAFALSRLGAFPGGASRVGCEHMIGDVWEWTSSGFEPYPGFEAFPYDHYSKVFFGGDYRVLRGGSWATRAGCATGTFRNWDHPYRRQIFAGLRLARDI